MNAKLIDFGLCWLGPPAADLDNAVTRGDALTMCGTIDFCPPETMLRGAGFREAPELSVFDVDCWALGVVLFIMLFGVMPFNMQERMIMAPMGKHPAVPLPPRPLKPGQFSSVLDLLKQMLNLDYSLRPGLDAVAAHKWVDR
jgi:serine/threonine protein kinase